MDQIILTTYRELNYKGIKFTMDDIAAQLGMSKKTIYKMFASKNDLVLTVVNAWIACAEEEENKILAEGIPLQQKIANFLFLDVPGFEYPTLLFFRDITRHLPEVEKNESPYANVIVVQEKDKDNPVLKKFVGIYQSEATKKFILDTFSGSILPAW